MTYVITGQCENCGACVDVCPSDAIYHVEGEPDWPTHYIYPDNCIECATCQSECEAEAIYHEVPDEFADDIQKNIDFFEIGPGKDLI